MVVTRCNYHCAVCTLRSWTLRACAVLAASALQSTELGTVGTCRHLTWQLDAEPRIEHTQGRGDGMAWLQHNSYVVNQYNFICIINIDLLSKDTHSIESCPHVHRSDQKHQLDCENLSYGKKGMIIDTGHWAYRG